MSGEPKPKGRDNIRRKPGPDAETLEIEGPWEEAVRKALRKPPSRRKPQKGKRHP